MSQDRNEMIYQAIRLILPSLTVTILRLNLLTSRMEKKENLPAG